MTNQADNQNDTTHFGFTDVPVAEKVKRVGAVFHSVAEKYDLMNDLMSFGLHRAWKHLAIAKLNLHQGARVLDLAGGTGDLAIRISKKIGPNGCVTLADINESMLRVGYRRLIDSGAIHNSKCVLANAETLPFESNQFDRIIIGFGLRNVTDKAQALRSMHRCLKPGGKLLVLEFSKPVVPLLDTLYDAYSFNILPKLGQWVTKDAESYQYLAESIRKHPPQDELKQMMETAGFEDCHFHNLTGGIVAIHTGYKY